MGDGTRENPYTREDVLRLIKEHGGKAAGLDLSRKVFEDTINLSGLNLSGIILKSARLPGANLESAELVLAQMQNAYLWHSEKQYGDGFLGTNLANANLEYANLQNAFLPTSNLAHAKLRNANLKGASLQDANLREADLCYTNLQRADLKRANLQEATLYFTELQGANLTRANLQGASFGKANLEGADLSEVRNLAQAEIIEIEISRETKLENVDWEANYILGQEKLGHLRNTAVVYRKLKQWYADNGMYNIAAEFYYREMEAKRKAFWWGDFKKFSLKDALRPFKLKKIVRAIFPQQPFHWAWSMLINLLCGYGERPLRVIVWAIGIVIGLALIYFAIGTLTPNTFLDSLYYSAVSFIALGYGQWAPEPADWVKGLGVFETFLGFFMMTLLLVTFVRKWTR